MCSTNMRLPGAGLQVREEISPPGSYDNVLLGLNNEFILFCD